MIKKKVLMCILVSFAILTASMPVNAWEGDSGYAGGISSGQTPSNTTMDYREVVFLSGEPIVFKGNLTIKKSTKKDNVSGQNVISTTYTFKNMQNLDKSATLTRSAVVYKTVLSLKDNGQTVEQTSMERPYTETIKIGSVNYVLKSVDFTRSNLIDPKPAINYYAGDVWEKKTYQIGSTANGGTVTVEETGNFYGYDQNWSSSEAQTLNYVIESAVKKGTTVDSWGGTASINLSSNSTKQIRYVENKPNQISFSGGYVQTQNNTSILEYSSRMPEFDSNGVSTDKTIEKKDSLKLESFPVETRLPVPDLTRLRGHWAENDIKELFSLEIFKGNAPIFNPEQLMTRAEFISAFVKAAREVPQDPALAGKTAKTTTSKSKEVIVSPFKDLSTQNIYFNDIYNAFKRGIVLGNGKSNFSPNNVIVKSEAVTIFIRALGLEGLAPDKPVTTFADNDKIPSFTRKAAYVAEKIGLIKADGKGNFNPNEKLTKAKAAEMLIGFVNYMCNGIQNDYKDEIVNF